MAERSFANEVTKLRMGDGETFHGEGILAITKALLENGSTRPTVWLTLLVGKPLFTSAPWELPMGEKLTKALADELEVLLRDPKYGSSNRDRDQARTKLKSLGLIRFDRKAWEWEVLPAGRAALREATDEYGRRNRLSAARALPGRGRSICRRRHDKVR